MTPTRSGLADNSLKKGSGFLVNNNAPPTPLFFCKSIIPNMVKALCFDRLLQVLIPQGLGVYEKWIPK